mmetsp:Transcript_17627/g.38120  ORF Transcript_17627/g.38120 Transcript_17627/m.38120 type:complete len:287 (-) Transcript_17627:1161-2021(-)
MIGRGRLHRLPRRSWCSRGTWWRNIRGTWGRRVRNHLNTIRWTRQAKLFTVVKLKVTIHLHQLLTRIISHIRARIQDGTPPTHITAVSITITIQHYQSVTLILGKVHRFQHNPIPLRLIVPRLTLCNNLSRVPHLNDKSGLDGHLVQLQLERDRLLRHSAECRHTLGKTSILLRGIGTCTADGFADPIVMIGNARHDRWVVGADASISPGQNAVDLILVRVRSLRNGGSPGVSIANVPIVRCRAHHVIKYMFFEGHPRRCLGLGILHLDIGTTTPFIRHDFHVGRL